MGEIWAFGCWPRGSYRSVPALTPRWKNVGTASSEWAEPSRRHKVVRAEEAHFEMAADRFLHPLALLILLMLGGKTDLKPQHQWMAVGTGWSSLDVSMASLHFGTNVGFSGTAGG